MAYVPVPKDLNAVKTKVMFNLTKRQLLCFGGGALVGVPLFFLLKGSAGSSAAAICMIIVMLPFFLLAMYLYLEKLTPTILNDMVSAVYVHAPDKSSGHRVQDVTISYNYIGILPANLLYDVMNGKGAVANAS